VDIRVKYVKCVIMTVPVGGGRGWRRGSTKIADNFKCEFASAARKNKISYAWITYFSLSKLGV